MATLPQLGAVGWNRYGKRRVAGIVEGYVIARVRRGGLMVMSAEEWSQLLPHEWTEADRQADDADQLLRALRFPSKSLPSVKRHADRWVVTYFKPKQWEGKVAHLGLPIEYVRLNRPASTPLLEAANAPA